VQLFKSFAPQFGGAKFAQRNEKGVHITHSLLIKPQKGVNSIDTLFKFIICNNFFAFVFKKQKIYYYFAFSEKKAKIVESHLASVATEASFHLSMEYFSNIVCILVSFLNVTLFSFSFFVFLFLFLIIILLLGQIVNPSKLRGVP
jgi:hypothetical protein